MNRMRVYTPFQSMGDVQKLYNEKKPTAKRVINLLSANPTPEAEQNSLEHFKRLCRALMAVTLGAFYSF